MTAKYMKLRLTALALSMVPDCPPEAVPTPYGAQLTNAIGMPGTVKEVLIASLFGTDEETKRGIYLDVPAEMLGDSHSLGDEFILIFKRIDRA